MFDTFWLATLQARLLREACGVTARGGRSALPNPTSSTTFHCETGVFEQRLISVSEVRILLGGNAGSSAAEQLTSQGAEEGHDDEATVLNSQPTARYAVVAIPPANVALVLPLGAHHRHERCQARFDVLPTPHRPTSFRSDAPHEADGCAERPSATSVRRPPARRLTGSPPSWIFFVRQRRRRRLRQRCFSPPRCLGR